MAPASRPRLVMGVVIDGPTNGEYDGRGARGARFLSGYRGYVADAEYRPRRSLHAFEPERVEVNRVAPAQRDRT